MSRSECELLLEIKSLEGGGTLLKFSELVLGFKGILCTIEKSDDTCLMEKFSMDSSACPKFIFRVTHGLKNFAPLFAIVGCRQYLDSIRFYHCEDRKRKNRIFVSATTSACGGDGGGVFLVKEDCFNQILAQLENLEADMK